MGHSIGSSGKLILMAIYLNVVRTVIKSTWYYKRLKQMSKNIIIRELTIEDRVALWVWRNDPVTLRMFKKKSFKWDKHCLWFEKLLKSTDRMICIAVEDTIRIGSVRFDMNLNRDWSVCLYLKPMYCGKGYSSQTIKKAVEYISKLKNPNRIFAKFNKINEYSIEIFRTAGFSILKKDDHDVCCEITL